MGQCLKETSLPGLKEKDHYVIIYYGAHRHHESWYQSLQKETSYIETVADRNTEEYILYVFYILDQV